MCTMLRELPWAWFQRCRCHTDTFAAYVESRCQPILTAGLLVELNMSVPLAGWYFAASTLKIASCDRGLQIFNGGPRVAMTSSAQTMLTGTDHAVVRTRGLMTYKTETFLLPTWIRCQILVFPIWLILPTSQCKVNIRCLMFFRSLPYRNSSHSLWSSQSSWFTACEPLEPRRILAINFFNTAWARTICIKIPSYTNSYRVWRLCAMIVGKSDASTVKRSSHILTVFYCTCVCGGIAFYCTCSCVYDIVLIMWRILLHFQSKMQHDPQCKLQ